MKNKNHYNIGNNNPRWKGGKSHCIVCDKKLSYYKEGCTCRECQKLIKNFELICPICGNKKSTKKSKTCIKCDSIRKSINYKGDKNPMFGKFNKLSGNYKHGGYSDNPKKCPKCGKEIWFTNNFCSKCVFDGERNPNFNGWSSKEPYSSDWTVELKDSIRKRDNYECQNCNMTEEEHLIVMGQVLHIHHIDYDKKNCKESNLLTLCFWCNIRANTNRNYWQQYYKNKTKEINQCKL